MLAKLAGLLAVAGVSSVHAQELWSCDKNLEPNYDACDRIVNLIDWQKGPYNGGVPIPAGECTVITLDGESGQAANCAIAPCNVRSDGGDAYLNTVSGRGRYGIIKSQCKPAEAGGRAPGPDSSSNSYLRAYATPENFARSSKIRGADRFAEPQLRFQTMTIEKMEEMARNATETLKKRNIQKRQQEVIFLGLTRSVPQPGVRDRMSGYTTPGVATEWTTTEGFSTSVGISASISVGFFDIFTAEVGIDVSMEYTQEFSVSTTFDASKACAQGQDAYLYWEPYFDLYTILDENDKLYEIYIPIDAGKTGVQCLG